MNQPPSSARQRSIALAVFFYRWLLMLYPRSFRQRYGAQMLQVFRDSCREARQARGCVACWVCGCGRWPTCAKRRWPNGWRLRDHWRARQRFASVA